jgi:hypothetical protein
MQKLHAIGLLPAAAAGKDGGGARRRNGSDLFLESPGLRIAARF